MWNVEINTDGTCDVKFLGRTKAYDRADLDEAMDYIMSHGGRGDEVVITEPDGYTRMVRAGSSR